MESGETMERALIVAGTTPLPPIMLDRRPFCRGVFFGLGGSMLMTLVAIPAISATAHIVAGAGVP